MEIKDNLIVIGPSYLRKKVLEDNKLKHNIKYIDEYELKDKYLYTYKEGILVYMDKTYGYSPEISNIVLNTLYDIDINKEYSHKRLNDLKTIKEDLINKGFIIFNPNFKSYLTNKDILVLNNFFNKRILKIINELSKVNNITYENKSNFKRDKIDYYECKTIYDEVKFIASSITDLINKGIDINKIYLNSVSDDYRSIIYRTFTMYGIPCNIKNNTLYSLEIVRNFLDNISLDDNILSINEKVCSLDSKLSNKIVNIFNKYVDYECFKDVKEEIIYELKNTTINFYPLKNAVREIDFTSRTLDSDEYIFIFGCNDGIIPSIRHDDGYLSNEELEELGLDNSVELTKLSENYFNYYVNNNNVFLSYKLKDTSSSYSKASIFDKESNFNIIKYNYTYDNKYLNNLLLGSKLDNYFKYNEKDDELLLLNNYDIDYKKYDNNFKGIDYQTLKKQTNGKLNISTSLTDIYYGCKFRCLLNNIYKIEEFVPTMAQKIGSFFHDVLCTYFKDGGDLDTICNERLPKYFIDNTNKENFYTKKYIMSIKELVPVIEKHLNNTSFKNKYFEKRFTVEKANDLGIKVTGVIDKILTFEDKDSTYVIVIDYKTGNPHDFRNAVYGIDMQLGFYFYLINNSGLFKNPKFAGMYLQKIMSDILPYKKDKTYEEQLNNQSRLNGYSLKDALISKMIDNNLEPSTSSEFVSGLKLKKDGDYDSKARVIDEDTFNEVMDIISKKIEDAITDINKGDFAINPKVLGDKNIGCEYCTFKDICYKTPDNDVELDKELKKQFLGGVGGESNEEETGE